jgi:excisionase family DNA binding protein
VGAGIVEQQAVSNAVTVVRIREQERVPFLTPKTLAAYLSISERTARAMLGGPRPKIASYRVEGQRRIAVADVDAYLRRHRSEAS